MKRSSLAAITLSAVGILVYLGATRDQSTPPATKAQSAIDTKQAMIQPEQSLPVHAATPAHSSTSRNARVGIEAGDPTSQSQVPALEPGTREALKRILNTSSEGLTPETHNGITSVHLQGRFQTAPVATLDTNGDVQITDYNYLPKASPP